MLIFSTFIGEDNYRAYNAVRSWLELGAKVVLMGEETWPVIFDLNECDHDTYIERTEEGTPLLSSLIHRAQKYRRETLFCYVNGDIILFPGLVQAAELARRRFGTFLMTGRRIDVEVGGRLPFGRLWELSLLRYAYDQGRLLPPCGADWFVFTRGLFDHMPPFAIGRCTFDNWMIYDCLQRGIPVIDATREVKAIHQVHEENPAVRTNPEAQRNYRLAKEMYPKWTAWHGWMSHATEVLR